MEPVKRAYDAPRREQAAQATRLAVLAAARALFLERGWSATTVQDIADRAGVSRPTVFALGGKAALLTLVRDLAMAGDAAPVAVKDRDSFQRVLAESRLGPRLDLLAEHVAGVQSRYAALDGVLYQAAGADAELRELWETAERQRRTGAALSLAGCEDQLAVPLDDAVDALWALMASEPYRRLVLDRGWLPQAFVTWLAGLMRTALLP